jgi:GT2 family glycosyltransferase
MAIVSILVPARRADYLGRALISAQRQTFQDIEILVGDDTPDGALEPIVTGLDDPRIRYFHTGFQDERRNARALWRHATGRYVKWLAGDDLLMPTSVEALLTALREHPDSALAFHGRVFIDANDAVVHTPASLLKVGERGLIDHTFLVEEMIGGLHNFIGEISNTLLDRMQIDEAEVFTYRSMELDYLNDVAMFLNASRRAPLVAVGGYWSMRRRDPSPSSPSNFSAGLYEWELFARGEAASGSLRAPGIAKAAWRLEQQYVQYTSVYPEIARLCENLRELTTCPAHALFETERFRSDLSQARAAVAARIEREKQSKPLGSAASGESVRHLCVICEEPVQAWVPRPGDSGDSRGSFVRDLSVVGASREQLICPHCASTDRDRHLWLYVAFSGLLEKAGSMRILHIAPEPAIEHRIRRLAPLEYVTAAAMHGDSGQAVVDVEALGFPDGHFDLIICNDTLERIARPEAALIEMSRCLKPDGHLIAQTLYSASLKHTFEPTGAASAPARGQYLGYSQARRVFGADVAEYFRAAGLEGEPLPHAEALAEIDAGACGCGADEPFFLFSKAARVNVAPPVSTAVRNTGISSAPPARVVRPDLPIRLVCATRHAQANFLQDTALGRSLIVQRHAQAPELLLFDNNSTGLSTLYNAAIEQAAASPAILVFVHDDVSLNDFFWPDRIRDALREFDIVGVAGNRRRVPQQPAWAFVTRDFKWDQPEFLSGSVGHGKRYPCEISRFGPSGVECKLLDGLLLAADSTRLIASGARFDEQFKFHFYDMDFCRQAELKGLRMGTWPISLVHESEGAFGTPAWREAFDGYLRKYGE